MRSAHKIFALTKILGLLRNPARASSLATGFWDYFGLLELNQVTFQRNTRHDGAGVAFVVLGVFAFVAFVEADDVGHRVCASAFCCLVQADDCRLGNPFAGYFVSFVKSVGFFVGHRAGAEDGGFAGGRVAGEVELHAAVDFAGAGGFGDGFV